jgi:hypothetical protein
MKKAFGLHHYGIVVMTFAVVGMTVLEGLRDKHCGKVCKDECLYECN